MADEDDWGSFDDFGPAPAPDNANANTNANTDGEGNGWSGGDDWGSFEGGDADGTATNEQQHQEASVTTTKAAADTTSLEGKQIQQVGDGGGGGDGGDDWDSFGDDAAGGSKLQPEDTSTDIANPGKGNVEGGENGGDDWGSFEDEVIEKTPEADDSAAAATIVPKDKPVEQKQDQQVPHSLSEDNGDKHGGDDWGSFEDEVPEKATVDSAAAATIVPEADKPVDNGDNHGDDDWGSFGDEGGVEGGSSGANEEDDTKQSPDKGEQTLSDNNPAAAALSKDRKSSEEARNDEWNNNFGDEEDGAVAGHNEEGKDKDERSFDEQPSSASPYNDGSITLEEDNEDNGIVGSSSTTTAITQQTASETDYHPGEGKEEKEAGKAEGDVLEFTSSSGQHDDISNSLETVPPLEAGSEEAVEGGIAGGEGGAAETKLQEGGRKVAPNPSTNVHVHDEGLHPEEDIALSESSASDKDEEMKSGEEDEVAPAVTAVVTAVTASEGSPDLKNKEEDEDDPLASVFGGDEWGMGGGEKQMEESSEQPPNAEVTHSDEVEKSAEGEEKKADVQAMMGGIVGGDEGKDAAEEVSETVAESVEGGVGNDDDGFVHISRENIDDPEVDDGNTPNDNIEQRKEEDDNDSGAEVKGTDEDHHVQNDADQEQAAPAAAADMTNIVTTTTTTTSTTTTNTAAAAIPTTNEGLLDEGVGDNTTNPDKNEEDRGKVVVVVEEEEEEEEEELSQIEKGECKDDRIPEQSAAPPSSWEATAPVAQGGTKAKDELSPAIGKQDGDGNDDDAAAVAVVVSSQSTENKNGGREDDGGIVPTPQEEHEGKVISSSADDGGGDEWGAAFGESSLHDDNYNNNNNNNNNNNSNDDRSFAATPDIPNTESKKGDNDTAAEDSETLAQGMGEAPLASDGDENKANGAGDSSWRGGFGDEVGDINANGDDDDGDDDILAESKIVAEDTGAALVSTAAAAGTEIADARVENGVGGHEDTSGIFAGEAAAEAKDGDDVVGEDDFGFGDYHSETTNNIETKDVTGTATKTSVIEDNDNEAQNDGWGGFGEDEASDNKSNTFPPTEEEATTTTTPKTSNEAVVNEDSEETPTDIAKTDDAVTEDGDDWGFDDAGADDAGRKDNIGETKDTTVNASAATTTVDTNGNGDDDDDWGGFGEEDDVGKTAIGDTKTTGDSALENKHQGDDAGGNNIGGGGGKDDSWANFGQEDTTTAAPAPAANTQKPSIDKADDGVQDEEQVDWSNFDEQDGGADLASDAKAADNDDNDDQDWGGFDDDEQQATASRDTNKTTIANESGASISVMKTWRMSAEERSAVFRNYLLCAGGLLEGKDRGRTRGRGKKRMVKQDITLSKAVQAAAASSKLSALVSAAQDDDESSSSSSSSTFKWLPPLEKWHDSSAQHVLHQILKIPISLPPQSRKLMFKVTEQRVHSPPPAAVRSVSSKSDANVINVLGIEMGKDTGREVPTTPIAVTSFMGGLQADGSSDMMNGGAVTFESIRNDIQNLILGLPNLSFMLSKNTADADPMVGDGFVSDTKQQPVV